MTDETLYILIIVLSALNVILLFLNIYLYFADIKLEKLEEEVRVIEIEKKEAEIKTLEPEVQVYQQTPVEETVSIYAQDEFYDDKKKYAPLFKIKKLSLDDGYIFYRTDNVKYRGPSEKEFRDHIKEVIETKASY